MTSPERSPFPSSTFGELAEAEIGHWWFKMRNAIVIWALDKKVKPFRNYLEIGCGTGYVLEGVSRRWPDVEFHGSEYFEEGLEVARSRLPGVNLKQLDATCLDETERYDVIGAYDVLEHIVEDQKVLNNMARALRPGGAMVLTVPQHPWLWSQADDYACHVRRYSKQDLLSKISQTGLTVSYASSFVSLLVPLMWLSRKRQGPRDPMIEFKIPAWMNKSLEAVMSVEMLLMKIGVRFGVGGSLLVIAEKGQ